MNHTLKLIAGIASLAIAAPASAGLIGESYFGAHAGYNTIDVSGISNPDGWLAGVGINHPASIAPEFGIDLGANLEYRRLSGGGIRMRGTDLGFYGTLYIPVEGMKPFLRGDTGWTWHRRPSSFRLGDIREALSDNSWFYGGTAGVEFALSDTLSLTPSVSWKDYYDFDNADRWSFGILAHNWFNPTTGGSLGYEVTEGPNRHHTVTVGVTMLY